MKPLAIVSLHASPIAPLGAGENGGMNVYLRAVCEELSSRGIATEVFTRRASREGPDRVQLAEQSWVTRLAVGPPGDLDKAELFELLPAFATATARERRRGHSYSLLHSHYWLSGWVADRLRDEWKLPWFHTFHTLARVKNERAAEGAAIEPAYRIKVEQMIVRESDRLIASSAQEANDLVQLYGAPRSRVSVVAPGVDLQTFQPWPTAGLRAEHRLGDAPVIVFAGRLERLKGAEIVIRALGMLPPDPGRPLPVLLIIGDNSQNGAQESAGSGGERLRLAALSRTLGLGDRVRFLGAVDQTTLARYLSLAAVCVVPSYSESFGLVALEAAACGTPVVAARVGGLPAIVKDGLTGFTLLAHDPAQFAERIGRLLVDEDLRQCFSRRSRLVASQFTWQATVDRLLNEYAAPRLPELRPAATG